MRMMIHVMSLENAKRIKIVEDVVNIAAKVNVFL